MTDLDAKIVRMYDEFEMAPGDIAEDLGIDIEVVEGAIDMYGDMTESGEDMPYDMDEPYDMEEPFNMLDEY